MNATDYLISQGWKEYPDQFRKYARCFYKRYDTPTRCHCNHDKEGVQVCIAVSELSPEFGEAYEMDIAAELPDDSWIKLYQWAMPKDIEACIAMIPRLIVTWEFVSNFNPTQPTEE